MKIFALLLVIASIALVSCDKKVSPTIEGNWVMPANDYMRYSLALDLGGHYTRWFWHSWFVGENVPENPQKGHYTVADDWVNIPVQYQYCDGRVRSFSERFKRQTINEVEVLLSDEADEIWRRCGLIYIGGLLIKVSDHPNFSAPASEPKTDRLFRNGVKKWTKEAEATK